MLAEGKKVLLADGDDYLIHELAAQLRQEGWEIAIGTDGDKVLPAVKRWKPDVIILGSTLAGMDGLALLQELKGLEETSMIPVVMLTLAGDRKALKQALDLGASRCIAKPCDIGDLIKIVGGMDGGAEGGSLMAPFLEEPGVLFMTPPESV